MKLKELKKYIASWTNITIWQGTKDPETKFWGYKINLTEDWLLNARVISIYAEDNSLNIVIRS